MNTASEPLAALREQIVANGWNRKATARVLFELLVGLAVTLAGIWLFVAYSNFLIRACAILISTLGAMAVSTNTHTSSHYATSTRRWMNEALTYFGYPFFGGMSACYWWHKHVVVHHPAPNIIGVDGDVDLLPYFARTREEVLRTSGLRRFYYERIQFLAFPFAVAFIGFNMQAAGWRWLLSALRRSDGARKREWIDLAALVLHYLVWLILPMAFFPPLHVLGLYCLRIGLLGFGLFAVLAPGHFPAEAACLNADERDCDHLLLQTVATVNFRTGPVGKLLCSGLEYQIEHHLFPNLSHIYYPQLAVAVKEVCRSQGLPYRCYSWPVVLWKSWRTLLSPPPVQTLKGSGSESMPESLVGRP